MKMFEVESIHLSDCILDKETFVPYKILNLQVKVKMEEVQDFRVKSCSDAEVAEWFGHILKSAYFKYCAKPLSELEKKKRLKFSSYDLRPKVEEADEGRAGWYDLKESENENKETSDR